MRRFFSCRVETKSVPVFGSITVLSASSTVCSLRGMWRRRGCRKRNRRVYRLHPSGAPTGESAPGTAGDAAVCAASSRWVSCRDIEPGQLPAAGMRHLESLPGPRAGRILPAATARERRDRDTMSRQIFVTTALPYANAPFHIGHMMEYIQADIWVRFQRMQGHAVHFVCADDAHGAPIMIAAEKVGKTPQQFVAEIAAGRKPLPGRLPHRLRQLALDRRARRTTQLAQDIYCALRREGPDLRTHDRAVLRPGQGDVPARPLHQGRMPALRRQGPVRRLLRGLRRGLLADRAEEPVFGAAAAPRRCSRAARITSSCSVRAAASTSCSSGRTSRAGCSPRC